MLASFACGSECACTDDHSSRPHIHLSAGQQHDSLDDDHHHTERHHDGRSDEEQGHHRTDFGDANFEIPQWVPRLALHHMFDFCGSN